MRVVQDWSCIYIWGGPSGNAKGLYAANGATWRTARGHLEHSLTYLGLAHRFDRRSGLPISIFIFIILVLQGKVPHRAGYVVWLAARWAGVGS